jgi:hypothetical protein
MESQSVHLPLWESLHSISTSGCQIMSDSVYMRVWLWLYHTRTPETARTNLWALRHFLALAMIYAEELL